MTSPLDEPLSDEATRLCDASHGWHVPEFLLFEIDNLLCRKTRIARGRGPDAIDPRRLNYGLS